MSLPLVITSTLVHVVCRYTELHNRSNQKRQVGNDSAISMFSQVIAIDPTNNVLDSNRSAARAGKKEWAAAL